MALADHIERIDSFNKSVAPDEFAGKVVLISGGAGGGDKGGGFVGVGHAAARRFAAGGATVVVTDIREDRTQRTAEAIAEKYPHAEVDFGVLDVADLANCEEVFARCVDRHGAPTIVINNAVANFFGGVMDGSPENWQRTVDVNLTGTWNLAHVGFPLMRDAGGGAFLTTSTYAADVGPASEAGYSATKGGVHSLTRAMANEGRPHRIRANVVSIGFIDGSRFMAEYANFPREQFEKMFPNGGIMPENVADALAFFANDRACRITGEILNISDGLYMRS